MSSYDKTKEINAEGGGEIYPWTEQKNRVAALTAGYERQKHHAVTSQPTAPLKDHLEAKTKDFIAHQVQSEKYWFQKIELFPGVYSPGWSDPASEKLPYYGLPEDLSGLRVLDIGCAEGYFSFEAEKRGAREVVAIDSFPDSIRRFNIVKNARQSNANAYLCNVYDLNKAQFGTFDLVLFYGVFYHLKHPQLALEAIRDVCTGTLLFQTYVHEDPRMRGEAWAQYNPYGLMSGSQNENFDPTVFWLFNATACIAMLDHVGFESIRVVSDSPKPFVLRAESIEQKPGCPVNQATAPWC